MLKTCLEDGGSDIGLVGIFNDEVLVWVLCCVFGDWERETKRARKDEKKEKERRERKKEALSVHLRKPDPLSEGVQPAGALRVQWPWIGFNAYSEWKIKKRIFTERETKAHTVHHRQPVPFQRKGFGLCSGSTKACSLCHLLRRIFSALWVDWLFQRGNTVWDQYQGLSMISKIMLPSLTGTLELNQLQDLDWFRYQSSLPHWSLWSGVHRLFGLSDFEKAFTYTHVHIYTHQATRHTYTPANTYIHA